MIQNDLRNSKFSVECFDGIEYHCLVVDVHVTSFNIKAQSRSSLIAGQFVQ